MNLFKTAQHRADSNKKKKKNVVKLLHTLFSGGLYYNTDHLMFSLKLTLLSGGLYTYRPPYNFVRIAFIIYLFIYLFIRSSVVYDRSPIVFVQIFFLY